MRRLTFRPALTIRGRKNKGLRGFAGKPYHPPLTDVPITAYLFTAAFDVLSVALQGSHHEVGRQLYVAGTWTLSVSDRAAADVGVLESWKLTIRSFLWPFNSFWPQVCSSRNFSR